MSERPAHGQTSKAFPFVLGKTRPNRSISADPLYRFLKNGKAGYIDVNGRVAVLPKLTPYGNYCSEFHDGRLEVAASGGKYMDRTGQLVIHEAVLGAWIFPKGWRLR